MKKNTDIAKLIASTCLRIGAIELRPENPFLWAGGTYNPIYNDNRMLLGSYEHRVMVSDGFVEIMIENDFLRPNYICATSLSGIAPAVTLGKRINKPVMIFHEGKFFVLLQADKFVPLKADENLVIATAPWAIAKGVLTANEYKLPFAYIRPKRKDHGKGKLIEGIIHRGQKAFVPYIETDSFEAGIKMVLFEEGIVLKGREILSLDEVRRPLNRLLHGQTVLVLEDLISTGGSALKEVRACKEAGAEVLGVASIFNYDLPIAKKQFQEEKCPLFSILNYDTVLEQAKEEKRFSDEIIGTLHNWRLDPENWGDNHGFPRVIKEQV